MCVVNGHPVLAKFHGMGLGWFDVDFSQNTVNAFRRIKKCPHPLLDPTVGKYHNLLLNPEKTFVEKWERWLNTLTHENDANDPESAAIYFDIGLGLHQISPIDPRSGAPSPFEAKLLSIRDTKSRMMHITRMMNGMTVTVT